MPLCLALIMATSGAHAGPAPTQARNPTSEVADAPSRSAGSAADEARYAQREVASPGASEFRGGDVIVISATALAVILLVVLILVLI